MVSDGCDLGCALGAAGAGLDVVTQAPLVKTIEPDAQLRVAMAEGHERYKHAYNVLKDI